MTRSFDSHNNLQSTQAQIHTGSIPIHKEASCIFRGGNWASLWNWGLGSYTSWNLIPLKRVSHAAINPTVLTVTAWTYNSCSRRFSVRSLAPRSNMVPLSSRPYYSVVFFRHVPILLLPHSIPQPSVSGSLLNRHSQQWYTSNTLLAVLLKVKMATFTLLFFPGKFLAFALNCCSILSEPDQTRPRPYDTQCLCFRVADNIRVRVDHMRTQVSQRVYLVHASSHLPLHHWFTPALIPLPLFHFSLASKSFHRLTGSPSWFHPVDVCIHTCLDLFWIFNWLSYIIEFPIIDGALCGTFFRTWIIIIEHDGEVENAPAMQWCPEWEWRRRRTKIVNFRRKRTTNHGEYLALW